LVETILGDEIELVGSELPDIEKKREWRLLRLNDKKIKGFLGKVLFALQQAQDLKASALVAVVDRDKDQKGHRLQNLRAGRDEHRSKYTPIPTALGEANPHGEAWLLDDEAAVREALRLDSRTLVPSLNKTGSPKDELESLINASERRQEGSIDLLADIAKLVQLGRCNCKSRTGFEDFMKEVHAELGPLA